jgi:hypothetical protein
VSGFDDDTKEEELIAYFYRLVYGGGTRNINDGKVQSCHIISFPSDNEKSSEGASKPLQSEMKISLITFENKILADLALSNSVTTMFRDKPIFTELPNEQSYLMKIITENYNKLHDKNH